MSQISGKYGQAIVDSCTILEFESWSLTYGSETHVTHSRATGVAQGTVDGCEGGEGTIEVYLDPGDPICGDFASGELVAFELYSRVSSPVKWAGSARIGKWGFGASRAGEPQRVSIPFTTHGVWTPPT